MIEIIKFTQLAGEVLDLVGVFVIIIGAVYSVVTALVHLVDKGDNVSSYKRLRQNLGRSILLGLEFLVAGDIIRSITGTPDFTAVGVLVIIVLVRSFLSFTFEMEVEGHWPWQRSRKSS